MVAAGGIITGVLGKSIKDFAAAGDEIHKMSLRTGIAAESLSRFSYAAEIGGASLATIEKAAKRMAATIYDAGEGLSTSVDAFDNLGISVADFQGLKPEEQFMKLAGALADVEDASTRSALAQRIFGRAGTELLPMLAAGTEGLKEMMEQAEKFAPIFSADAAEAAAEFTDSMTRLKGTMEKTKHMVAEALMPTITSLVDKVTEIIGKIKAWRDEHPELFDKIVEVTSVVGLLLIPLGTLLIMMPMLSSGIVMVGHAFKGMLVAMGPIGWIITGISIAVGLLLIAWKENWGNIRGVTETVVEAMVHAVGWLWDKIMWFIEKLTSNIAWVMKQIANVVNVFSHDWAMSIWNAAESMTQAVSGFRDDSVAALKDFDVNFQKGVESVEEGTDKMTSYGTSVDSTTAAINRQIQATKELTGQGRTIALKAHLALVERSWEQELTPFEQRQMELLGERSGITNYQHGGIIPGPIGQPVPIIAHGGEMFLGASRGGSRAPIQNIIHIFLGGHEVTDLVLEGITEKVRLQGGL